MRTAKRLVKLSPIWPILRPRRFHAYCVGPAKTGTSSVYGMFSSRYRSGHEAAMHDILQLACLKYDGKLTKQAAKSGLRKRDRKLRLEMDSFNHIAVLAKELAEEFPKALFLLTLREPRSWLKSIINQHLRVDVSNRPLERRLRQLFFLPPGVTFGCGEEELQCLGLFPIDGYLKGWSARYEEILDVVPGQRLLVIRTEDLSESADQISAFLSIPSDSIDLKRSHLHRAPRDFGVFDRLPQALVEDRVQAQCAATLSRIDRFINSQLPASGGSPESTAIPHE